MSNRSGAFPVCEVGEASVLHQILGGHKIAKIERGRVQRGCGICC